MKRDVFYLQKSEMMTWIMGTVMAMSMVCWSEARYEFEIHVTGLTTTWEKQLHDGCGFCRGVRPNTYPLSYIADSLCMPGYLNMGETKNEGKNWRRVSSSPHWENCEGSTLTLKVQDVLDLGRGDNIVCEGTIPSYLPLRVFVIDLCKGQIRWMSIGPLQIQGNMKYDAIDDNYIPREGFGLKIYRVEQTFEAQTQGQCVVCVGTKVSYVPLTWVIEDLCPDDSLEIPHGISPKEHGNNHIRIYPNCIEVLEERKPEFEMILDILANTLRGQTYFRDRHRCQGLVPKYEPIRFIAQQLCGQEINTVVESTDHTPVKTDNIHTSASMTHTRQTSDEILRQDVTTSNGLPGVDLRSMTITSTNIADEETTGQLDLSELSESETTEPQSHSIATEPSVTEISVTETTEPYSNQDVTEANEMDGYNHTREFTCKFLCHRSINCVRDCIREGEITITGATICNKQTGIMDTYEIRPVLYDHTPRLLAKIRVCKYVCEHEGNERHICLNRCETKHRPMNCTGLV